MHTDLEKNMRRVEDSLSKNIVKEIDIIKAKLEESKCSQVEIVKKNDIRWSDIVKQNTSTEEQYKKVSKVLSNPAVNAKAGHVLNFIFHWPFWRVKTDFCQFSLGRK